MTARTAMLTPAVVALVLSLGGETIGDIKAASGPRPNFKVTDTFYRELERAKRQGYWWLPGWITEGRRCGPNTVEGIPVQARYIDGFEWLYEAYAPLLAQEGKLERFRDVPVPETLTIWLKNANVQSKLELLSVTQALDELWPLMVRQLEDPLRAIAFSVTFGDIKAGSHFLYPSAPTTMLFQLKDDSGHMLTAKGTKRRVDASGAAYGTSAMDEAFSRMLGVPVADTMTVYDVEFKPTASGEGAIDMLKVNRLSLYASREENGKLVRIAEWLLQE